MIPRNVLNVLVMSAIFLPPAALVVWGLARLLNAMGDEAGARAVDYVAIAVGGLWATDLVFIVLSLGMRSLSDDGDRAEEID